MERTRCFVAVPLELPVAAVVDKILQNLKAKVQAVRWGRPDNLHLTVKFLGDLDNRDLPEACQLVRSACEGVEPFLIKLQGVGAFPRHGAPRVVWLGIEDEMQSLSTLHKRLDRSFESLGVRREGRAYRPHLTLGRPKSDVDSRSLELALQEVDDGPLADMEVDELQLVASFLGREGPSYQVIDTIELE